MTKPAYAIKNLLKFNLKSSLSIDCETIKKNIIWKYTQPVAYTRMLAAKYVHRNMKIVILSLVSFVLLGQTKQDSSKVSPIKNHTFFITPTQLLFRELMISYEVSVSKKIVIGYTFGYRLADNSLDKYKIALFIKKMDMFFNPYYTGTHHSFYLKHFIGKSLKAPFYLKGELFYRHWAYENKVISESSLAFNADRSYYSRSEEIDVFGVKFLVGFQFKLFNISQNSSVVVDLYTGLGYRTKYFMTTKHGYYRDFDNPLESEYSTFTNGDRTENYVYNAPSVQGGFKIGIGIGNRKIFGS